MSFWNRVDKLEGGMASAGAGLCLFIIMLITVASIFGRYVLGMDLIPGGYNMIESIAFPLLVFLAIPIAHRQGMFPRFDMLAERLPRRLAVVVALFVTFIELAIFTVLLWHLGQFAWSSFESGREAQIGTQLWPIWPVIFTMPLAFGLVWLEIARQAWKTLQQCFHAGPNIGADTDSTHGH